MYRELSPETREFFDFMMENQLFDVLGRKNKKAGGYMTYLPVYHAPFIFANFNGTSGDVDVITHECGHAFQGYLSGKDPVKEHRDITMETLRNGQWLGEYSDLTLTKGMFFPLYLALCNFLHLSYLNVTALWYTVSCMLFVYGLRPLLKKAQAMGLLYLAKRFPRC